MTIPTWAVPVRVTSDPPRFQRKNPPRIAADGFWAKQFTLNKTPWLTGPVKQTSKYLSTGLVRMVERKLGVHQRR